MNDLLSLEQFNHAQILLFHEVHFTTVSLIMVHFVYGRKCFSSIAIVAIVVVKATILVRGEGIYMAGIMAAMMSFVWRQQSQRPMW